MKEEGGLLDSMKEEQDVKPAKRVRQADSENLPVPPTKIRVVAELQKLCSGFTSEKICQYVPQLGKDISMQWGSNTRNTGMISLINLSDQRTQPKFSWLSLFLEQYVDLTDVFCFLFLELLKL